jgi:hypothetical protein
VLPLPLPLLLQVTQKQQALWAKQHQQHQQVVC